MFTMKITLPFSSSIIEIAGLGVLALALTGCALQTIHIRTVDANTGEPLAGVTTEWRQDRLQMFQTIVHSDAIKESPSGYEGMVEVGGVHRNWASTLAFSCPGYLNVYSSYSGGTMTLAKKIVCIPFDPANERLHIGDESKTANISHAMRSTDLMALEGESQIAVKSNGWFIVPMQKSDNRSK
jgi:hypothetical protein